MNSQLPEKIKNEETELLNKYFSTDKDEDLIEFLRKNASKEYLDYMVKKDRRDKELLEKGIIEN